MQRSNVQTPGTERVNVRVPPGMTAGQEIQFPNTHGFYFKVRAPPSPACAHAPIHLARARARMPWLILAAAPLGALDSGAEQPRIPPRGAT